MDKVYRESYNQAIKALERYARKIAKNNESLFEELMGEANLGISERMSNYDPSKCSLKTYFVYCGKWKLLRYVKNEVKMGLNPVFLTEDENIEDFPDEKNTESSVSNDIDVNLLLKELDKMDKRRSDVIQLYYLEQKTFQEVGECLNISTERAKQILQEAIIELKTIVRRTKMRKMKTNHK